MSQESSVYETQFDDLKKTVLESIRKEGLLNEIEAEIKEVVHKVITSKEPVKDRREKYDERNLLINQLIADYLHFNNYKHTLSVLQSEANIPQSSENSESVQVKLGVSSCETNKQPLLYTIINHFLSKRTTDV